MAKKRKPTMNQTEAMKAALAKIGTDDPADFLRDAIVAYLYYWSAHERNMAIHVRIHQCMTELKETEL